MQLNDEIKGALQDMQNFMRDRGVKGNYTKRENLHLTLAFIGEFDDPQTVLDAIDRAGLRPFEITLSGTGSFKSLWWAGIDGGMALQSFARRLRRELDAAGIPYDHKKFSPHITLIRKPECCGTDSESEILTALNDTKGIRMTVDHVSLMRSDRGEHGMIYTEIK
ncbi:MAG: RNA 2',3'-cyclic phosphodiesterase [Mogibacterium sp.]|nr:RNA 2',3'-cyclic phosphodiesterase [Mogibacterium sp.]